MPSCCSHSVGLDTLIYFSHRFTAVLGSSASLCYREVRNVCRFYRPGRSVPFVFMVHLEWWGKDVKGNRAGLSVCKFRSFAWWDWRKSWELRQGCRNASRNSSKAPQEYVKSCHRLSRLARWRLCWIGEVHGRYFKWQIPSLLSHPVAVTSICYQSSSSRFSLMRCSSYSPSVCRIVWEGRMVRVPGNPDHWVGNPLVWWHTKRRHLKLKC
jgi:hypothetical protein